MKTKYMLLGCLLSIASLCQAQTQSSVLVSWSANSESDLAGYKLYYGTTSRNYDTVIEVGNITSFVVDKLVKSNRYYFVVTAIDFSGNESEFSDEVDTGAVDRTPPKKVDGIILQTITIIQQIFN